MTIYEYIHIFVVFTILNTVMAGMFILLDDDKKIPIQYKIVWWGCFWFIAYPVYIIKHLCKLLAGSILYGIDNMWKK